jgi:hypothetical protein
MTTFACVYTPGEKFYGGYVNKLYANLRLNGMTEDDQFICLSDADDVLENVYHVQKLIHGFPGWWSKLELFRPGIFEGRVIYFDLDTLILKDISRFMDICHQREFMMLRGFNEQARRLGDPPASGIMTWHTDSRIPEKLYETFMEDPDYAMNSEDRSRGAAPPGQLGDQGFIGRVLGWGNIPKFQDFLPPGYIMGKRHVTLYRDEPPPAHIVAWSGYPALQDASIRKKWINEAW